MRLERALPAMSYYGPGHAAMRQSTAGRGARHSRPRAYNPHARGTQQMYAWDIRGGRPLPLVPLRHGASIGQPGAGRRGPRDMGSPISAVLQAGQMRPATALDGGSAEKPRSLPKLVIIGERQEGHISRAHVPRAVTLADRVNYGLPHSMARTKANWASSELPNPLSSSASGAVRGVGAARR